MVSVRAAQSQVLYAAVVLLLACSTAASAVAQSPKSEGRKPPDTTEQALSDEGDEESPDGDKKEDEGPPAVPAPPAPKAPPAANPLLGASPFTFSFKGTVAMTMYAQDVPVLTGNGLTALTAPASVLGDGWFIGGDVRQTRFSLAVTGPQLLGAATLANIEAEWIGGNQIATVGVPPERLPVIGADGMPVGAALAPIQRVNQGDESLLPRLRVAYIELNWDNGQNVLRVGQYHNLLLAMISTSGAQPALGGYGAGQLGWRAPGITYSHRFTLSDTVKLDAALQINRNSWRDSSTWCVGAAAPPASDCLPLGVSLGEAGTPQVQTRLMLLGPLAPSPSPHYAPTLWQLFVVGHWDQKDLSGVGLNTSMPALRDSMTTYVIEGGGKVKLGPLLIAANGWVGQNAGQLFGHIFQMQTPDKGDVRGFGAWSQVGLSLTDKFSVWGLAGIDQPNRDDAIAADFGMLRNFKATGMLAYIDGPLMVSLEWLYIATTNRSVNPMTGVVTEQTLAANQPSMTFAYGF